MSAEKSLTLASEKVFSDKDIALIKQTVAKGATDAELQLFLYRCKNMGLDPLKPGQIHFVKYGNNPGTVVVGIEGFRTKAANTGKHVGTKRGVLKDEKGKVVGAWCEVYRSDWKEPAREEVSLGEYSTGKAMWVKMPETMIKKVAEVAALRMAFPDELGGVYVHEELEQAKPQEREAKIVLPETDKRPEFESYEFEDAEVEEPEEQDLGDYVLQTGKANKGRTLKSLDREKLSGYFDWYRKKKDAGQTFPVQVDQDMAYIKMYLERGE